MGKVKEAKAEEKEGKEEKQEKPKPKEAMRPKVEVRGELIRLADTDIDADKPLFRALTEVNGIKHAMSKAICAMAGMDPSAKLNTFSEQDREKLESVIYNPGKFGLPSWMMNRRKDHETGADIHLIGADLDVAKKFDIQRMVDLKTYKGVRHMYGMPVRGQRTRSTHHKGKTVGVVRKSARIAMAKSGEGEKKKEEKK